MPIIVSGIRSELQYDENEIIKNAIKRLQIQRSMIKDGFVLKSSLDARKKKDIHYVHSVFFELYQNEESVVKRLSIPQVQYKKKQTIQFSKGEEPLQNPIIVVGFGPAGMFSALTLARNGYNPIVIERGACIEERQEKISNFWNSGVLDADTNVQFGEGGAGTFSDGKLTTRISDPLCDLVLQDFVSFGAPRDILKKAKPHIGTDNLRVIVKNIRKEIEKLGGKVLFRHCLKTLNFTREKTLYSITVNDQELQTDVLLLAVGHSARDTFAMLHEKEVYLEGKPFSVGARIEHLQKDIDQALYGNMAGNPLLPKGEYQLSYRENGRGVYTFCMCPGGIVVPASSEENGIVTNGMSEYARKECNANAALVVGVSPNDFGSHPLDGISFQRKLEEKAFCLGGRNYKAPAIGVQQFLKDQTGLCNVLKPSYNIGVQESDFRELYPSFVMDMLKKGLMQFEKKLNGYINKQVLLTGVETRTSSPVRIKRNDSGQSISHHGIYPCGEGSGYAGGIMSAAVDGIKAASKIMEKYSSRKKSEKGIDKGVRVW